MFDDVSEGASNRQQIARCLEQIATAEEALGTARRFLSDLCTNDNALEVTSGNDAQNVLNSLSAVSPPTEAPPARVSPPTSPPKEPGEECGKMYLDQAVITCFRDDQRDNRKERCSPFVGAELVGYLQETRSKVKKSFGNNAKGPWLMATSIPCVRVPVFSAEDPRVLGWTYLSFVFIAYIVFSLPFSIAFDAEPTGFFWVTTQIITWYFLLDVPFNFMIATCDDEGRLVKDPGTIARRYLRGWFWLDALTSIPWDWLPADNGRHAGNFVRVLRVLRMLRVTRLLRLLRTAKLMDRFSIEVEASLGMCFCAGVTRIVLSMLAITHWSACCWYYVGVHNDGDDKSWISEKLTDDFALVDKYLYSVYFTLTTMTTVGYGDVTPQNKHEVCFTICLLIVASFVFAALLGSFGDLFMSMGNDRAILAEKKRMLGQYRRWRDLPHDLFIALRHHVIFSWDQHEGFIDFEEGLKQELPPVLRRELCFHIYAPVLKNARCAPFLAFAYGFDAPLKELATMVVSLQLAAGDFVFRRGDPRDRIYMLVDGSVRICQDNEVRANIVEDHDCNVQGKPSLRRACTGSVPLDGVAEADQPRVQAHESNGFSSQFWVNAKAELQAIDEMENKAALVIQRAWRKRLKSSTTWAGIPHASAIKSRTMFAPAYFGEACLWVPYKAWEVDASTFLYALRCETVAEVVCLPRQAVHRVLEHFSPWLLSRFLAFTRNIAAGKLAELHGIPLGRQEPAFGDTPSASRTSLAFGKVPSAFGRVPSSCSAYEAAELMARSRSIPVGPFPSRLRYTANRRRATSTSSLTTADFFGPADGGHQELLMSATASSGLQFSAWGPAPTTSRSFRMGSDMFARPSATPPRQDATGDHQLRQPLLEQ